MRWPILLLALFAASDLWAQNFSVTSRQQDLAYVSTQIPKLHPNFFFQLDPAVFQAAVASLNAGVSTLTDAEFYVGIAQLVALAGDAHTTIYLSGPAAANAGFHSFPLQLRWLDDGIFVTAAAAPYSSAIGAQLVRVGGIAMDDAILKLASVISHGNDQWLHSQAVVYLLGQQILQGLHLVPPGATSSLTFQTLAGDQFTLDVGTSGSLDVVAPDPGIGVTPEYLRNTSMNYWSTYVAADRLLYFRYNACANDPSRPITSFIDDVLHTLDANSVDTFVIDYRGNGGGNESLIFPLGAGLIERLPALLANPRFRIYEVIDKGTFSSASDDAMDLKSPVLLQAGGLPASIDSSTVIFVIGEPTGGQPSGYGEVAGFTLPGSGLSGQYSTQFNDLKPGIAAGPSFNPDIWVHIRSTDYFARYDPVMAAILSRSNGPPAAPSGNAVVVNAASFRADQGLAPGSYAAVFGSFGEVPDQVLISGIAGHIVAAAPSQVNFLVPASVQPGTAAISVRAAGKELAAGSVEVTAAGPGIFVVNAADPAQPGAIEDQDYSVNSAANPAAAGSILQIFGTGYGPLDSTGQASVQAYVGDLPAQVHYSGPVAGYPGLWQINAQLPAGVHGQTPVYLGAGGLTSNAATVFVK